MTESQAAHDWSEVLNAVEISSAVRYRLHDLEREAPTPEASKARLAEDLYQTFFMRLGRPRQPSTPDDRGRRQRIAELSNLASGHLRPLWEPGWQRRQANDRGRWIVERDGVTFHAARRDVRPESWLARVLGVPSKRCLVRIPAQQWDIRPGFFFVQQGDRNGRAELPTHEPVLRCYWHTQNAAGLLHHLVKRLDIPYRLKVAVDPRYVDRADTLILTLSRSNWPKARRVLERVYSEHSASMRPQVPLMTLALAPGLALAEGDGDLGSFGRRRCRLLAEALSPDGAESVSSDREMAIRQHFEAAGLDPSRPFLARSLSRAAAHDRESEYRQFTARTGSHEEG